ncbi:radical SAM protein [Ruegeria sp. HKCCD7255]|uniref:radical SAM protein n=1 Tax=Ruegeria sp. HKCCD7255 TaxID=2683004 RepID=UPI0014884845|nr:radical SAM protein [Ruegeria sp. HKCCD7255]
MQSTKTVETDDQSLDAEPRPLEWIEHTDDIHKKVVLVDWMLGNRCNYSCSYCPPALHDGSKGWQSYDDVLGMIEALQEHYHNRLCRRVWLQLTGGEPTLHPKIKEILSAARAHDMKVSMISNGSRTERFWLAIRDKLDSLILTLHLEEAEFDHVHRVIAILSEVIHVQVNLTMLPDRFDESYEMARRLGADFPNIAIVMKPLRLEFGDALYPYSDEQIKKMQERMSTPSAPNGRLRHPRGTMTRFNPDGTQEELRANTLILRSENRWQGWLCEAGLESLRITGDGHVKRAVCNVGGHVGEIGRDIELPMDPIVCDRESCSCVADILISRARWHELPKSE